MSEAHDQTRVNAIQVIIGKALADHRVNAADVAAAKEVVAETQNKGWSSKAVLMVGLANTAKRDNWTADEIKAAAKAAVANLNTKDISAATFASEITACCDPRARDHIARCFALARKHFEIVDEDHAALMRRVFVREYHCALKLIRATGKGETFPDMGSVTKWAIAHDPIHNAAKINERIKKMAKALETINARFPHASLTKAAKMLGSITNDELVEAVNAPKPAPKASEPAPEPEPVEGVFDVDAALREELQLVA